MKKAIIGTGLKALVSALLLAACAIATAEPPARVARLGYVSGTVSFAPAGQTDWIQAALNRPVTTGDRLWVDERSRAEVQIGGADIRLGVATSVTVLNLDDQMAQLQISQGSLKLRVRRMAQNQTFEIDTPNLAFVLHHPGEYRIDVDPNGASTAVMVQNGEAEVYGDGASYAVTSRRGYRFYGSDLSDYDILATPYGDDLELWSRERDSRADNSPSARYVSSEVVGYEDLDSNGTWRSDPNYGYVWTPSHVPAGWTPYRDGRWAWIDPWGWTWVDDAPWGYAVSHYGRWANLGSSWCWVPGPPREQAVYAPALVVFVGGTNFQGALAVGAVAASVGWFPLAPREVYRPTYQVSRSYFENVNRSNAVIAPANIVNVYNTIQVTKNTTVVNNTINVTQTYANQQVPGAVVAVPQRVFAQSQPVAKAVLPVSKTAALAAPIVLTAPVAPVLQSVHGGSSGADVKPPVHAQAAVTHTAPPPPPVPFAAQQALLAVKPGAPIDDTRRAQLKPAAATANTPVVSVLAPSKAPASVALPPVTPPSGKTPETRKAELPANAPMRVDPVRTDSAKGDTAPANVVKAADAAKSANAPVPKMETPRPDTTRVDAARVEAARIDAAKADAARAAEARSAAAKAEAARANAAKADMARAEALRAESEKAAKVQQNAARAVSPKSEESRPPVKQMHVPAPRSAAELQLEEEKKRAEEEAARKR